MIEKYEFGKLRVDGDEYHHDVIRAVRLRDS